MKLTPDELESVTLLAAKHDGNHATTAAGQPGSREQPLTYAQLLEQRRRLVGDNRD